MAVFRHGGQGLSLEDAACYSSLAALMYDMGDVSPD